MRPDFSETGSARDWIRHARSDLELAQTRKTKSLLYEHLCFHAQQAAEKSLKAVLLCCGCRVPRTHDLAFLIDALPENVRIPPSLLSLPVLTKYAVQQRYPSDSSPVRP
jgi:HEPN domain-containing protein